tara:strand:- start:3597 stop:3968 length:372 start_codon:yes stop_codon:yes gene_type:complete
MNYLDIKKHLDELFGIDIAEKSRKHDYIKARAIYYKLCKVSKGEVFTFQRCADVVQRNHATVMHGLKTFESFMFCDKSFKSLYEDIEIEVNPLAKRKTDKQKRIESLNLALYYRDKFNTFTNN